VEVIAFELTDRALRLEYDELFAECPHAFIQQSTHWAEVIQELGPDQPIFLLCRDAGWAIAGLPLYLFEHQLGNLLTSVPQAGPLGGVFVRPGLSPDLQRNAYRQLIETATALAEANHCLALTILSNPFWPDDEFYKLFLDPTLVFENFTQYVPLNELVRRSGGQKNNLARAKQAGFEIKFCQSSTDLQQWYQLHCRRQAEIGAVPLSFTLLENIFRILAPLDQAAFILATLNQEIVAGCCYVYHQSVIDVFAISMDSAHAAKAPNALLADFSMSWARSKGRLIYNWQSSPSRTSGVYNHKRQWGSIESPYFFLTKLFCEVQRVEEIGPTLIKSEYPGHYMVPFVAFEQGFHHRYFKKP